MSSLTNVSGTLNSSEVVEDCPESVLVSGIRWLVDNEVESRYILGNSVGSCWVKLGSITKEVEYLL